MPLSRIILVISVVAILSFGLASPADDAKPSASRTAPVPEFTGKHLAITTDNNGGGLFENAQLVTVGDRAFVVGNFVDMGVRDWRGGARVWIPVDSVYQVVEFDNLEAAKKAYELASPGPDEAERERPTRKPKSAL